MAMATQLSGQPLVRGSVAEGTRLAVITRAVSDDRRGWALLIDTTGKSFADLMEQTWDDVQHLPTINSIRVLRTACDPIGAMLWIASPESQNELRRLRPVHRMSA
jgi:hypothetical protein